MRAAALWQAPAVVQNRYGRSVGETKASNGEQAGGGDGRSRGSKSQGGTSSVRDSSTTHQRVRAAYIPLMGSFIMREEGMLSEDQRAV